MNKWLYTVLLLVAGSAAAETAGLENADCTKMKTYKLRTECLEAQGKTEAQSAREHGVQDDSPRLLDSVGEGNRSIPSQSAQNEGQKIVPRKNIKDGEMNIFVAQAVIDSAYKEISDCRFKYDTYWETDPDKVRPCLHEVLSTIAPGSDWDAARKFLVTPENAKKLSQIELANVMFNIKEMTKHMEYLSYRIKSKNEKVFP